MKHSGQSAYHLPSPVIRRMTEDETPLKFVVVTGGVCSSLGKGITTSATGALLRAAGFRVCSIKIDPYINVDAGLMSPYEHGEVYVLADGGEADLDLGNYERWMSVRLTRDHNITTGKVYQKLIQKERAGGYLGKTVQLVPHFTNEVVDHIFRVCQEPVCAAGKPEICLIELGGTVGDMESQPFIEALRRLRCSVSPEDFCLLHTTYLPVFGGTQKTKPTQHSCRSLLSLGLSPDFLICRSEEPLTPDVTSKLSNQCGVLGADIIGAPNVDCLYLIPVEFQRQGLIDRLMQKLHLPTDHVPPLDVPDCEEFKKFSSILRNPSNPTVKVAFVGKYVTGGSDAYFSVLQCFEHCQIALGIKLDILYMESEELEGVNATEALEALKQCDGIFVPGGFGVRGIEGKVRAVTLARTLQIPYLGVCLGMQVALIEFARNVLGWEDANSEEFDELSTHQIVHIMDCDKTQMGANMHLGTREVHLPESNSIMRKIYSGAPIVCERHRHRYEVNGTFLEDFKKAGMKVTGVADPEKGTAGMRVEAVELSEHPHFLAVQYHPEFVTSPLDPSPPFLSFFEAASKKKYQWPSKCNRRRLPGGK